MRTVVLTAIVVICLSGVAAADEFKIDPVHSSVNFSIKHMMVSNVKGSFGAFTGFWKIDPKTKRLEALEGTVDVASVDTNNGKRDEHLKNADFFETEKFPKADFVMLKHNDTRVIAKVTIKGITKPVEFEVAISDIVDNPMDKGKTRIQGITLTGTVKRKDFEVGAKYDAKILSEEVVLTVELEGRTVAE